MASRLLLCTYFSAKGYQHDASVSANGASSNESLSYLDSCQSRSCIQTARGGHKRNQEDYIKAIRSQGYMGYEVSQLTDLPNLLGGAKRYA